MSSRRGTPKAKRADFTGTHAGQLSDKRLGPTVTLLAIEQALAQLGVRARLSDIVAKAQPIENGTKSSPSRRKREHAC